MTREEFYDIATWVVLPVIVNIFMVLAVLALVALLYHLFSGMILENGLNKYTMKTLDNLEWDRKKERKERKAKEEKEEIYRLEREELDKKRDNILERVNEDFRLIINQGKAIKETCNQIIKHQKNTDANHIERNNKKKELPPEEGQ